MRSRTAAVVSDRYSMELRPMAFTNSAIFSESFLSGSLAHLMESASAADSSAKKNESRSGVSDEEGIMLLVSPAFASGGDLLATVGVGLGDGIP